MTGPVPSPERAQPARENVPQCSDGLPGETEAEGGSGAPPSGLIQPQQEWKGAVCVFQISKPFEKQIKPKCPCLSRLPYL